LSVDGVDQQATWGTQVISLPTGPHVVKILVYAQDGDAFGLAETPVTVDLGAPAVLVYKAPRFHGSRGKLRITRS
jgi:hypothetical protein